MIIWKVPKRCPRVSILPDLAMQGIKRETQAPLTNPYTSANTIMPAREGWVSKGNQRPIIEIPVRKPTTVMTLKYPILSPMWGGMMRPGMDAALGRLAKLFNCCVTVAQSSLNDRDEIESRGWRESSFHCHTRKIIKRRPQTPHNEERP